MRPIPHAGMRSAALTAALACIVTGCSVSVGESEVEDNLQQQIADANPDISVDGVDCPGGLDGEVDATLDCTTTIDGVDYPVTLTVTEVDGSDIAFDYEIKEG